MVGIAGNLQSLMQPFDDQDPMNMMVAIAQMGIQNPERLASLLASKNMKPPTQTGDPGFVPEPLIPGSPLIPGAPEVQGLFPNAPGASQNRTANALGTATPQLTPPPGEGLLQALGGLKAPAPPEIVRPPGAIGPRPGGAGPNPELLAQLLSLMQGGAPSNTPSLGQLIGGSFGT